VCGSNARERCSLELEEKTINVRGGVGIRQSRQGRHANILRMRGEVAVKAVTANRRCWCEIKNNNRLAGVMLPPTALASGCHPARTDSRGGGGAKTPPLQRWGKAKRQQSTVCNKNNNNQPVAKKIQHCKKGQKSTGGKKMQNQPVAIKNSIGTGTKVAIINRQRPRKATVTKKQNCRQSIGGRKT